jgi:uncharacterized metal-binding protein
MMMSLIAVKDKMHQMEAKAVQDVETFSEKIVWKVADVATCIAEKSTLFSNAVEVGGGGETYSMCLQVVFGSIDYPDCFGIYLYSSSKKGCQIAPVGVTGSSLRLEGIGRKSNVCKKIRKDILACGAAHGYVSFVTLKALKTDHCSDDTITIEATICIKNRHYVARRLASSLRALSGPSPIRLQTDPNR